MSSFSCERRESRAAARSQAGAPLSWTSEQADTLFVCERVRKAAAHERQPQRAERAMYEERAEAFFPLSDCSLPLAADRAGKAPTLSSLADEKRVVSLLRSTAPRDPVRATTTAADSRCSRRRSLKKGRERSEHQPQRRAVCRRRWRNNALPFRQIRRRRRQPSEHRSERQRPIKQSATREQLGLRGFAGEGHDQPGHKRQEGSQPER